MGRDPWSTARAAATSPFSASGPCPACQADPCHPPCPCPVRMRPEACRRADRRPGVRPRRADAGRSGRCRVRRRGGPYRLSRATPAGRRGPMDTMGTGRTASWRRSRRPRRGACRPSGSASASRWPPWRRRTGRPCDGRDARRTRRGRPRPGCPACPAGPCRRAAGSDGSPPSGSPIPAVSPSSSRRRGRFRRGSRRFRSWVCPTPPRRCAARRPRDGACPRRTRRSDGSR